ncbi:CBO0543 family protein [Bacillus cereus]
MDKLQKTTAKHSKKLNSQFSQRKMSSSEKKNEFLALVVTIFLSAIIGTCLDAFFVHKQIYSFPARPFSSTFSVNIAFYIIRTADFNSYLYTHFKKLSKVSRILFIISIGICASLFEQIAESLGLFIHSTNWNHTYSLFGYMIFHSFIWNIYNWIKKIKRPL